MSKERLDFDVEREMEHLKKIVKKDDRLTISSRFVKYLIEQAEENLKFDWVIEDLQMQRDHAVERLKELDGFCIHCNGKGFNGLDYCTQCVKGKNLKLEQQNKRYREVLEFYASKETHEHVLRSEAVYENGICISPPDIEPPAIYFDKGEKSRQVLEADEQ